MEGWSLGEKREKQGVDCIIDGEKRLKKNIFLGEKRNIAFS